MNKTVAQAVGDHPVPCKPCEEKKRQRQIERELREIALVSAEIVKED
jgi:hypothetical protein